MCLSCAGFLLNHCFIICQTHDDNIATKEGNRNDKSLLRTMQTAQVLCIDADLGALHFIGEIP